jgi:hypothetical protein
MQSTFVSCPHFFRCEQESGCSSLKGIPLKRTHTGNKRRLIVVVDTGGCCRWWREWELIKRLDTPHGTTLVYPWFYTLSEYVVSGPGATPCFLISRPLERLHNHRREKPKSYIGASILSFNPETLRERDITCILFRDSSVSIEDGLGVWRLGKRSSIPGSAEIFYFCTMSIPAMGIAEPPDQWVLSLGCKANTWSYISSRPYVFRARCLSKHSGNFCCYCSYINPHHTKFLTQHLILSTLT